MSPEETTLQLLAEYVDHKAADIRPEHRLIADLQLDGDDYGLSLVPRLEAQLRIEPELTEWERIWTVGDLLALIRRHTDPG